MTRSGRSLRLSGEGAAPAWFNHLAYQRSCVKERSYDNVRFIKLQALRDL